jgi:hypothetical protein
MLESRFREGLMHSSRNILRSSLRRVDYHQISRARVRSYQSLTVLRTPRLHSSTARRRQSAQHQTDRRRLDLRPPGILDQGKASGITCRPLNGRWHCEFHLPSGYTWSAASGGYAEDKIVYSIRSNSNLVFEIDSITAFRPSLPQFHSLTMICRSPHQGTLHSDAVFQLPFSLIESERMKLKCRFVRVLRRQVDFRINALTSLQPPPRPYK